MTATLAYYGLNVAWYVEALMLMVFGLVVAWALHGFPMGRR